MMLLTKALRKQLPPLYSQEDVADPMVICKFFYPDFSWTWFAIEYDGEDLFFGFVDGDFPELGYFCLSELMQNRGKLGMPIERDLYFKPCRLSELRAKTQALVCLRFTYGDVDSFRRPHPYGYLCVCCSCRLSDSAVSLQMQSDRADE